MDEVRGVGLDALGGLLRVVGELVAHVDLGAGDAPVAVTAGPALFVEVEVDAVAGISGVSGPDLDAGAGVAGEDGGGVTLVVWTVDVVGLVERAVVAVGHLLDGCVGGDFAVAELVGGWDALGLLRRGGCRRRRTRCRTQRGLVRRRCGRSRGLGGAVGVGYGVVPEAGGAVAAFGGPDALGVFADVADVGVDGGADLGADGLVGAEEGHVAVGGAAGDDVDEADLVEVAEGADDVAVEVMEVFEGFGEEVVPEAGGLGEVSVRRTG